MPRDKRLYMTFPIDFDEHPKIEALSDLAFRAFVAMNGYSRRQRLDGRIPAPAAEKRWKVKVLEELVASDPEKPLVLLVDGAYIIRDYAEHQFTTADEQELYSRKARAGAEGGRAKARAVAGAKQQPKQGVAGSGIEIDKTDVGDTPVPVTEVDAGVVDEDEFIRSQAAGIGIRNMLRVRTAVERVVGPLPDPLLIDLVRAIVELSLEHVRSVEAYVETTCLNSPDEVRAQLAKIPTPERVA